VGARLHERHALRRPALPHAERLDEGNREALAVEVGTSLSGPPVVAVLDQLVAVHGAPNAVRCDNGPELVSAALCEWAERRGVALHHIQPGKPNQNAYIERFTRTYRRWRCSTRTCSPRWPTCAC
jgi:transposase InsO family protein